MMMWTKSVSMTTKMMNLVEIRLNAQTFVRNTRRAIAKTANGIGIWMSILSALVKIAVMTNSILIAHNSEFIERGYYNWNKDTIQEDYTAWRYTESPTSYTGKPCFYKQFRDNTGERTETYWHITYLKLIFIIAFNGIVGLIGKFLDFWISDVPIIEKEQRKFDQLLRFVGYGTLLGVISVAISTDFVFLSTQYFGNLLFNAKMLAFN